MTLFIVPRESPNATVTRMVIFSGLFTAFGRLIGAVATMTIAWAANLLFGRVPQSRQIVLSFVALGSLGWVVAVLGVLVPTVGNLVVSAVPRTPQIEISWLRWTMILLAVFLPASVGLATILLLPVAGRSRARVAVGQALRGYPYTVGFALTIVFLGAWGLVRRIHALRHKWESAHIPMIVKPGCYASVADDIESAMREAGYPVARKNAPPLLLLPTRLVALLGGPTVARLIPDELVEFDVDDLNVLVYPFDVALLGREELVTRARAAIARRLAVADAYLTAADESEQLEDRLAELTREPRPVAAEFASIDKVLDGLVMPFDQWETVYWLRLQAGQAPPRERRTDRSEEREVREPLQVGSNALSR